MTPTLGERAAALLREARLIHARHPRSSFDNVWHTLWLLELTPTQRLQLSLTRGRALAAITSKKATPAGREPPPVRRRRRR